MEPFEVDNGTLELKPTPGHINLIAHDGAEEVELRLTKPELEELRVAMFDDVDGQVDTETGLVAWEKGRGMYVELFDGPDFYLIIGPADRETITHAMLQIQPL